MAFKKAFAMNLRFAVQRCGRAIGHHLCNAEDEAIEHNHRCQAKPNQHNREHCAPRIAKQVSPGQFQRHQH